MAIGGRVLPTVDEFQKMTYAGKMATRGDNLKRIDKNLLAYDVFRVKTRLNESEAGKGGYGFKESC